jgi:hypothetical protein
MTLFLTYAPSWLASYYRYPDDWLAGCSREQRIILRPYDDGEDLIRPPRDDLPLFRDDGNVGEAPPETDDHKIRRFTRRERFLDDARV